MFRRLCIALAAATAACHPARPPLPPGAAADGGVPDETLRKARAAWAERDADPHAIDRAIQLYEDAAARASPVEALIGAAWARRLRAERRLRAAATAPDAAEALASVAHDARACAAAAHRAWSHQDPPAAALNEGTHRPAEVYERLGPASAEPLYLEAVCNAIWLRTQGFTPLIERRSDLLDAFRRVAKLAPQLDGAGAEREMGTLLAALPSHAGGDLQEARAHFEAALERAPEDPRNRLHFARTVAVKSQDRELFVRLLRAVAEGQDNAAAAEASELLARTDELFGPAEAAQPIPGGPLK